MSINATANRLWTSRALRVGVAVGIGVTARVVAQRAAAGGQKGLVDWERAERIARGRLRSAPARLTQAQLDGAGPAYQRHMARVVPLLEARLGAALPGVVERHSV